MKQREAFLALDFGTSNVHVTLIDSATAEAIAGTSKKYGWYTPKPNEIELHAEEIWDASEHAVARLLKCLPQGVHIIGLTFFRR